MNVDLNVRFASVEFDSQDPDNLSFVLASMSKVIAYQLSNQLKQAWYVSNPELVINFLSIERINSIRKINERTKSKRAKIGLVLDEIEIHGSADEIDYVTFNTNFDFGSFSRLNETFEQVEPGVDFAVPVHRLSLLSEDVILKYRNLLVDRIEYVLVNVSNKLGGNTEAIVSACAAVKKDSWFVEKKVGPAVYTRGNNPRKAQLIARWESDYIYHSARVFNDQSSYEDILFMIYWRAVGARLLDRPGKLSWVNKDILKFIPSSKGDYRFAFNVNKGDVDFSTYFTSPQRRGTIFYTHFSDEELAEFQKTNTIDLNF